MRDAKRMPESVRRRLWSLTKTNSATYVAIVGKFETLDVTTPSHRRLNTMASLDYNAMRALYEGEFCVVSMLCVPMSYAPASEPGSA